MQSSRKVIHSNSQSYNDASKLPTTCLKLLDKVGSAGVYQRNVFLIFVLVMVVTGATLLSTSFLFLNNQYQCQGKGLLVEQCRKVVCDIEDSEEQKRYFVKNKENIKSIATSYGPFICEDQFTLDVIASLPFFASLIGFGLFAATSSTVGRRTVMLSALGLATLGSIIQVVADSLGVVLVGVIMASTGVNVASSLTFGYLGEIVQNQKRQKYSILIQVAYTSGSILITGLYYALGNWRIVTIIIQTIPIAIVFFLFTFYGQQTPMFLLRQPPAKALRALNRIGYINFSVRDILTQKDLQSVIHHQESINRQTQQKISICHMFRYRSLRINIICTCILAYTILSMYYGPSMIIDKIGFDTYVSNVAINLSELICYVPCYYFIHRMERRKTGFWMFLVAVVSTVGLVFVEKPQNCHFCWESVIEIIIVFIFRFSISTYYCLYFLYVVELFPTKVVGFGLGAVNIAATIATTLIRVILGALQRTGFNLMLFFTILSIISCAVTLLLQQTKGKPLKEEIEELVSSEKSQQETQSTLNVGDRN